MTNEVRNQEIKEKLVYQRAIYRFHDCDDQELKKYYGQIIREYEVKHGMRKKDNQPLLPGFIKAFDGRGIA